ncbi:MAG: hypothetical protein [Circular genetic element sp.]|nr:MAG: hypothetical protein [Circular genetic element sp.]
MDNANWNSISQTLGTVEDENRVYKILRVVGYFTATFNVTAPSRSQLVVRAWPGFENMDTGTPTIPGFAGQPGTVAEQQLAANEKWWWERIIPWIDVNDQAADRWNNASSVSMPHAYMADFKPNMWMGDSLTPALSIANNTDQQVEFRHRWRALVAY